ncbi:MAG: hypothetical protein D3906_13615, partial [Candidatus Electrothrix sp. AUS1_2]|nr:hypothetical protein [Candidatus Electrothrix sp. AUS1_2]
SSVEIRVGARFDPQTCSATSTILGSAGTQTVHQNFTGSPQTNTYYSAALANKLHGSDLDPAKDDIGATFNSAVGTTCPFPDVWYYGLDGNPPANTIDFVTVVMHELAHGLGFQTFVDLETGAKFNGYDDAYMLHLEDHSTGKMYPDMTDAERLAASINTGNLHWTGPVVLADSFSLTAGKAIPSGHVLMYAPDPAESGSSVSHWDKAVTPDEQQEPSYTGADHTVGLSKSLLCDIGWCSGEPVDLFILVDLSGSFFDDIEKFREDASNLVNTLANQFDLKVGLGSFVDYPINPFGDLSSGDYAYKREIDLTSDIAAVTSFIEDEANLQIHWGYDGHESQLAALYQAATGAGQTVAGYPGASIPAGQNAHFRDGVVKLFLVWTDAGFHVPGDPGDIPYPGPSFDDTVDAVLALDPPQVLSVISGDDFAAIDDAKAIAEATNAFAPEGGVDCDDDGIIDIPEGDPLVCTTLSTGEGIGRAIEKAVKAAVEAGTPVAKCK